jgi:hypothetical protein
MVKTVVGATQFTLTPPAGRAYVVKDIQVVNPSGTHVTVTCDRRTVGYFRVSGQLGNHLPIIRGVAKHSHDWLTSATTPADVALFAGLKNAGGTEIAIKMIGTLAASTTYQKVGALTAPYVGKQGTLLRLLAGRGLFSGYPVPSGKTFTLTGVHQSTSIVIVEYEEWDEMDIRGDMPNGPEGMDLLYVSYGNTGATLTATGTAWLDTLVNPAEFPAFPFGDDVPGNTEITLYGILASSFSPNEGDGTDYHNTQYLKLIKDRDTLFDNDKNGLPYYANATGPFGGVDDVGEGYCVGGNYSDVDAREPFWLPAPMKFISGEELNVYWTTAIGGAGKNIVIAEQEVGMILGLHRTR